MNDKSYIRKVAELIKAKFDQEELPDSDLEELFDSYAVLALGKGSEVTNEDVHNAWSAWATKFDPENKSILPFNELPKEVQFKDTRFTEAIREVARSLAR